MLYEVKTYSFDLKRIPLEKRPRNVQYRHLLKAPDLNSGTECSEVFGCVSGQDVVGSLKKSSRKDAQFQYQSLTKNSAM